MSVISYSNRELAWLSSMLSVWERYKDVELYQSGFAVPNKFSTIPTYTSLIKDSYINMFWATTSLFITIMLSLYYYYYMYYHFTARMPTIGQPATAYDSTYTCMYRREFENSGSEHWTGLDYLTGLLDCVGGI